MRLAPVHAAKKPWWRTAHRRQVSDEIMYLLTQGPLVIKPDERLFALELWRKHQSQPRRWPTQHQWAAFFGVDLQTVVRWVRHL